MIFSETKAAIELLKELRNSVGSLQDKETAKDILSKLYVIYTHILEAKNQQSELLDEINVLKDINQKLNIWEQEKIRYQLVETYRDNYAYKLKEDYKNNEPIHFICPNCFEHKTKSILQSVGINSLELICPKCSNTILYASNKPAHSSNYI